MASAGGGQTRNRDSKFDSDTMTTRLAVALGCVLKHTVVPQSWKTRPHERNTSLYNNHQHHVTGTC